VYLKTEMSTPKNYKRHDKLFNENYRNRFNCRNKNTVYYLYVRKVLQHTQKMLNTVVEGCKGYILRPDIILMDWKSMMKASVFARMFFPLLLIFVEKIYVP